MKILEREGKDTHPFIWSISSFIFLTLIGWNGGYKAMGVIGIAATYLSQGFELVPSIAYQIFFSLLATFYGVRFIRRQITNSNTGEVGGILSDEDYFRMAIAGLLIVLVVILMFMPLGNKIGSFLEGDEIFLSLIHI